VGNTIRNVDGTVGAPAYTFTSDLSLGMFRPAPNVLGFSTDGVERMRIYSVGLVMSNMIRNVDGTVGEPAYTFNGDPATGIFRPDSYSIGFSTNATERMRIDTNAIVMSNRILNISGTALAPAYSFSSDVSTGMFRPSANTLAFCTSGRERMRISSNGDVLVGRTSTTGYEFDINGALRCSQLYPGFINNADGTALLPAYSFFSDLNTGMYRIDEDTLGFSTAGVERMRITSTGNFTAAGTYTAADFVATSDQRTKTNIETISNALDIVKELRGVYFTRIGQTKQTVGVIAQEVETVLPEVVHTDSEGLKSVSYGNMVGVLIEAVKALSDRLEKIEKKE
jgi:hypothetical protein